MSILLYTLKSVAFALTEPYLVAFLIILAFVLYRRNKKTSIMQKMIIGERINSPFELTISQIVIGIFAGTIASIMMSYLGIVFDENSAVDLVFLLSIVFMFFNQRFICFSYSGSVLGIMSIVLGFLSVSLKMPNLDILKIDIVALMSMVAVLHFIEGFLIILDGDTGYIPVFTNRSGRIIGGFALQRYWTLPVAMFFILHSVSNPGLSWQIPTPNWWPLVNNSMPSNVLKNALVALIPFYGVIGYNSITFTRGKKEKTLMSGGLTIIYSLALFALAQLAALNIFFKILVLVFAPVAHEGMIIFQRRLELKGTPKYTSDEEGIMVLEVAPNSPANEMGISTGDLLVEINSEKVENEEKISEIIRETSNFIWFKVKKVTGKFEEVSYNKMNTSKRLGIVFVPKGVPKDSMVVKFDENKFAEILQKIKNKDRDE
ncbi:membrane protein [Clostridium carboxidivorans P7]|uniref:PDZ/DHR/GLGF domain protein n=1 Tax=Clostridium carboxidivorans P7 TaxID=536227 RepID=C6PNJ5_9CLOT|nr:PDZ domain-containing protein [Clostridium carboxidivorans]AKN32873.1 membrane protein [Clostridium carboxidivorans P7]EET89122.1 PDZ/DHR/GLGF domain protein [Clostridium carboxidivorans P7]EFG89882.1 membrane protein, putative [Clostridium carboxidivorans P7]